MTDRNTAAPGHCRIVVLLSGSGTNLQAIIDDFHGTPAPGTLAAVISNRPAAPGLARAQAAGIPTAVLDHRAFTGRDDFDRALAELIDSYRADLVVLAGFMRILSTGFVDRYQGRLLNIHPSLLPRHRGLNTHQRALDAGDAEHGATVHMVTAELDGGPAILQARVPVRPEDTAEILAARVLRMEHRIYPLVVRWYCDGRLQWHNQGLWFDGQPLPEPLTFAGTTEPFRNGDVQR